MRFSSAGFSPAFEATPAGVGDVSPDGSSVRSDADMLAACRAGDSRAWDELVARYERLVFSVALRNGLTRDDAADVTQTTFVALLDSIFRLRQDERLSYWLMTVARRQSWRLRRRHDRHLPWTDHLDAPHDPVAAWENVADLHDALAEIQDPCRSLLYALYFDPSQPSYADISRRMGRAVGGLGPLRARCLQRLRTMLSDDGAWA
jgi:RNA polymerase sigma factor (sigma-70 family)